MSETKQNSKQNSKQTQEIQQPHQHQHVRQTTLKALVVGILIGFLFGFALEKSKVFLSQAIRQQMKFQSMAMLKVFLAATASSSIFVSIMEYMGHLQRGSKSLALGLGIMKNHGANVVGGFIMGIGLYLAGACPGTVLVQFGVGLPNAKYTLSGALVGAGFFGYFHAYVRRYNKKFLEKFDSKLLDRFFGFQMWQMSLMFGLFALFVVLFVEYTHPWMLDVQPSILNSIDLNNSIPYNPYSIVWNPILSGFLIGTLQIPAWYLLNHHVGTSSAYVTVASKLFSIFDSKILENAPYFQSFYTVSDFAQLGTLIGIVIAAAVSTSLSQVQVMVDQTTSPFTFFIGGFLLLFGARLGGGCASGHGISGMARLNVASLIVVFTMFAGGILTGLVVG